jgi:hypothetical protein
MRARDTDRNDTCQILDSALAEGQLSMEEHRDRVARATKAGTLGELQGLTTDLQPVTGGATLSPRITSRLNGKGWLLVGAAVSGVLAVVVVVGVVVAGNSDPTPSNSSAAAPERTAPAAPRKPTDPGAAPDGVEPTVLSLPKQLHTLGGMTGLLDQMRARFGDTTGIELAIFPDRAMLFRPDPNDDQSKLLYNFDSGWGDPTRRPRDGNDLPADLGAFDVKAVVEALRAAPETVGIKPDDVSEVVVDIDHIQDPAGPGALDLLVKVDSTSGGSGYIYLDSAGNTKRVEYPS